MQKYLVSWQDHRDFTVEVDRIVEIRKDDEEIVMFMREDKLLYALPKTHIEYDEVED